jgi:hypothetical protein
MALSAKERMASNDLQVHRPKSGVTVTMTLSTQMLAPAQIP